MPLLLFYSHFSAYNDLLCSLRRLKEKLVVQRKYLDEMDQHVKELEKDSGGENN